MATGPRYKVVFRRRRQGKTDYHARRRMISSNRYRLVVRCTNKRILVQIMQALPQGDRTVAAADSRQLVKLGWRGGLKNLPAAYLTGFLAGHLSSNNRVSSAILDIGLSKPIPGSRIVAAVKGAIDAGLEIPCAEKMFPSEKRLRGEHIAAYAKDLSKNAPQTFKLQFGKLAKGRTDLTQVPAMFDKTKSKIGTSRRRSTK